ncbi:MAG: PDZ domain-containing protein, partial [Candidatus Cloacimonetes bacterium]|nr:PDZ domain-containing protein [Candidatus Cloacimonadota bacterium]
MPLTIDSVLRGSLAAQEGLQANDIIISINENPINDFLDLQFFGAEVSLLIEYQNSEKVKKIKFIFQDFEIPLGIEPVPHKCRTCINDCIFCFIDQMPSNLRKSLYLKDDDFRLSFVFGNYITLTNLAQKDIERI